MQKGGKIMNEAKNVTENNNKKKAERLYKEGRISDATYNGLLSSFQEWEHQDENEKKDV